MSTEEENKPMQTPPDLINEAFEKNGVSMECSVCGGDDWVLLNQPDAEPVLVVVPPYNFDWQRVGRVPTIALSCTKCGYIRTHSRFAVDKLISEMRGQNG